MMQPAAQWGLPAAVPGAVANGTTNYPNGATPAAAQQMMYTTMPQFQTQQ